MPTEIECKVPLASFAPVEARLDAWPAIPGGEFLQDDTFFDTPQRELLHADRGLRLRSLTRVDEPRASARHILTFKGARRPGPLKQREELEVEVADPRAMAELLGRLGYARMLRFQKRRRRYRAGACWVELDTLPRLGRFVEIEGPDADSIARLAEQLGLDLKTGLTDSYASLLLEQARRQGLCMATPEFLLDD